MGLTKKQIDKIDSKTKFIFDTENYQGYENLGGGKFSFKGYIHGEIGATVITTIRKQEFFFYKDLADKLISKIKRNSTKEIKKDIDKDVFLYNNRYWDNRGDESVCLSPLQALKYFVSKIRYIENIKLREKYKIEGYLILLNGGGYDGK